MLGLERVVAEAASLLVSSLGAVLQRIGPWLARGRPPKGLPPMPAFEVHSPRVARIVACNPGPLTLQGTNCYLVGTTQRRCLIDTGEGRAEFDVALRGALEELGATIDKVVITHRHADHTGGIERLRAMFPGVEVKQYPRSLRDGERIAIDDDTTLQVLFTPGHCDDHCCFVLPQDGAIFSGDNVLGWGSTWFEDLNTYMASLAKMLEIVRDQNILTIYPAHGPPSASAEALIKKTVDHRRAREAQIIEHLDEHLGSTSLQVVSRVYDASLPPPLVLAAQSAVLVHLDALVGQGRVARCGLDWWKLALV